MSSQDSPSSLFSGTVNHHLAACAAHRYSRIAMAIEAFSKHPSRNTSVTRRRWRIGLALEVISLRDLLGALVIHGCTGGPFFSYCHFEWLDANNPDSYTIYWSKLSTPPYIPLQSWMTTQLSPEALTQNHWWHFYEGEPSSNSSQPVWWDATDDQISQYFPVQPIAVRQVNEAARACRMAQRLLQTMLGRISAQLASLAS